MHKKTSAPLVPWPGHHYLSKPGGGGGGGWGCRIQGPGPAAPMGTPSAKIPPKGRVGGQKYYFVFFTHFEFSAKF